MGVLKKLFLYSLFLLLYSSLCIGQDTLVLKNGRKLVGKVISVGKQKVTYLIPPDTNVKKIPTWRMEYIAYPGGTKYSFADIKPPPLPSKTDFYLSVDAGYSAPSISYHDGIVGNHFSAKSTFYFNHHFGITAKAGVDLNGTGLEYISSNYWGGFYIFQQYLAGVTYRIGGKPGFPFVDFVGLCGLCNAANPVFEQGGGTEPITVYTPGNGSGAGYYLGIDFTSSSDHLVSITFGAGCLYSAFSYPDYTTTISNYSQISGLTDNVTSKMPSKMNLALFQMYLGINFRLKKAER